MSGGISNPTTPWDATAYSRLFQYMFAGLGIIIWIGLELQKRGRSTLPRIGKDPKGMRGVAAARDYFLHNGRQLVEEGYTKYKDSKYVVQTADMERIIISNKYIDELRNLPSSTLDHISAQCERHLAWWNTLDVVKHSNLHSEVCRVQLNQNLGPVVANLAQESRHGIETQLTEQVNGKEDYTYITAFPLAMKLASHTVNRLLVGKPLCRDDRWLSTTMSFAIDAFTISAALRPRSILTRPFVYWFLDARRKLKEDRRRANELLIPLIKRFQKDDAQDDERYTLLYWMTQAAQGGDQDPHELVHKSLFLSLASIQSSVLQITHFIYDICEHPQYLTVLREEIESSVDKNGGWNVAALYAMQRLDSFVKESQRLNHPGLFSFNRKILKTVNLSDNTILPAGSFISMPTYALARDPEYYDDPLEFKPFRFYDMRQEDADEGHRHQFASTSPNNLPWGYGRAACPGRQFAALEIKLICAQLLVKFDMKFPDGQDKRPDNVYVDERITPDRTQKIGFRLRASTESQ